VHFLAAAAAAAESLDLLLDFPMAASRKNGLYNQRGSALADEGIVV
jgi:hypothetical protein